MWTQTTIHSHGIMCLKSPFHILVLAVHILRTEINCAWPMQSQSNDLSPLTVWASGFLFCYMHKLTLVHRMPWYIMQLKITQALQFSVVLDKNHCGKHDINEIVSELSKLLVRRLLSLVVSSWAMWNSLVAHLYIPISFYNDVLNVITVKQLSRLKNICSQGTYAWYYYGINAKIPVFIITFNTFKKFCILLWPPNTQMLYLGQSYLTKWLSIIF